MTMLLMAAGVLGAALWIVLLFGAGAWLRISSALFYLQPAVGPPLHALWQIGTSPYTLWREGGILRSPLTALLLAFAAVNAASALWSPDPRTAVFYSVATIVTVALALHGTIAVARSNPGAITSTLIVLAPVAAVQALSTAVFRMDSGVELRYYATAPARLLLGRASAALSSGEATNNVLDPAKAGGILFLNGNRASMVMGVTALVYAMYAISRSHRGAAAVAALSATGCAFTGSKTGIALLILTPAIAVFWAVVVRSTFSAKLLSVLLMSVVVVGTAVAVPRYASDYVERSEEALVPRRVLWQTAIDAGLAHPFQGLGFGGWEQYSNQRLPTDVFREVAPVVFEPNYPPHNMLLFSLTRVGVIGPVLIIAITLAAIFACVHRVGDQTALSSRLVMTGGAATWIWVFIHAMGDNTEVWGTLNSVPFLAMALAICAAVRREGPRERESDFVSTVTSRR